MTTKQEHKQMLTDNRLLRIENQLKRIEIILLKSVSRDKKITKELKLLEKEEKEIEKNQKKLESEESQLLKEMQRVEEEERWHMDVQFNCKAKIMSDDNKILCHKTDKACDMTLCPDWKKK